MSENNFNRRDFLKVVGMGGAAATLSGCGWTSIQNGKEDVVSYVTLPDYVIPSVANYFNSTCAQCDAGCDIMLRVREGRALKAEGNPHSPINRGKMCGLGQSGIQAHYNPDRVTAPMLNGQAVTWDKALQTLGGKLDGTTGDQVAFVTGVMSGHAQSLLNTYMDALGTKNRFSYEAISPAVVRNVNKKAYGMSMPRYRLDKAKVIVSFGADFLGAWISPVHFTQQYAQFRKGTRPEGRGVLVQIEPKMTLTGANADRWLGVRAGTEGIFALGLINALGSAGVSIPADIAAVAHAYTPERVGTDTGVPFDRITKLAGLLKERTPSLVLAGDSVEGYAHGTENGMAIAMLNHVLGNVGKTIEPSVTLPFSQFAPVVGNRASLNALNDGLAAGKYKVVFTYAANPVYSAPSSLKFKDSFMKAGFKVAFAHYMDETAKAADLVLPLDSPMEEWNTVVPEYIAAPQGDGVASYTQLSFRQPTMEKLYPNKEGAGTMAVCDLLLALIKQRKPDAYKDVNDFYTYLHADVLKNKVAYGGKAGDDDDVFWNGTVAKGIVPLKGTVGKLASRPSVAGLTLPAPMTPDASYPLRLIPHVSASIRDGRNANEPWLQEQPDPLTTVVWDSWVEINPKTAEKLGIAEGDIVEIASKQGSIRTQAYIFPGIHPDAISVPVGYGHDAMGRWAKGTGVNVLSILDPVYDKATGELAMNETHVKISKVGDRVIVIKDEGFAGGSQAGKKKIAVKVSASKVDLSKEV